MIILAIVVQDGGGLRCVKQVDEDVPLATAWPQAGPRLTSHSIAIKGARISALAWPGLLDYSSSPPPPLPLLSSTPFLSSGPCWTPARGDVIVNQDGPA